MFNKSSKILGKNYKMFNKSTNTKSWVGFNFAGLNDSSIYPASSSVQLPLTQT